MRDFEIKTDNGRHTLHVQDSRLSNGTVTYIAIDEDHGDAGTWLTATETRAVIAALQATLPAEEAPAQNTHTVVSAAELDALPVGAKVEDKDEDVWERKEYGWTLPWWGRDCAERSSHVERYLPGTLLNPEILDGLAAWELELLRGDELAPTVEKFTTAGTLRLDLRLFLGDRDITYALANPIADALEG